MLKVGATATVVGIFSNKAEADELRARAHHHRDEDTELR